MATVCSADETVPKLRKEVHLRFVTPASRRQSSTLQFLFAGGDAGVTKCFGPVSRVSRPELEEKSPPEAGVTNRKRALLRVFRQSPALHIIFLSFLVVPSSFLPSFAASSRRMPRTAHCPSQTLCACSLNSVYHRD